MFLIELSWWPDPVRNPGPLRCCVRKSGLSKNGKISDRREGRGCYFGGVVLQLQQKNSKEKRGGVDLGCLERGRRPMTRSLAQEAAGVYEASARGLVRASGRLLSILTWWTFDLFCGVRRYLVSRKMKNWWSMGTLGVALRLEGIVDLFPKVGRIMSALAMWLWEQRAKFKPKRPLFGTEKVESRPGECKFYGKTEAQRERTIYDAFFSEE